MDKVRYFIAVMLVLGVPPALGLWYAIHPFAGVWRRLGPVLTYLILSMPAVGLGWLAWRARDVLVGADLGMRPWLLAVGALAALIGILIARARRRHLTQGILAGIPELSRTDQGRLLTEGIYASVRNPRYLELMAFVIAYACVANFAGIWLLVVLLPPALHVVVLLEERELRDRFGADYDAYCRRVPRWIPGRPPR